MKHSIRWLPIHRISPVTSTALWYSQAIMIANLIASGDQVDSVAVYVQRSNYQNLTPNVQHDNILYDMQIDVEKRDRGNNHKLQSLSSRLKKAA